jgi:predicted RNase H-like nuclease (RuvC/YqgF family)
VKKTTNKQEFMKKNIDNALQLVSENESLKKECEDLKGGVKATGVETDRSSQLEDEVRHLQAQNAALQKNLAGQFGNYARSFFNWEILISCQ